MDLRVTTTYRNEDGIWKIAHRQPTRSHFRRPRPAPDVVASAIDVCKLRRRIATRSASLPLLIIKHEKRAHVACSCFLDVGMFIGEELRPRRRITPAARSPSLLPGPRRVISGPIAPHRTDGRKWTRRPGYG